MQKLMICNNCIAKSMTDDPVDAQLAPGQRCSTSGGVTGAPVVSAIAIFTDRGGSTCSATAIFCSRAECTACNLLCSDCKFAACIHETQARSKLCSFVIFSAKCKIYLGPRHVITARQSVFRLYLMHIGLVTFHNIVACIGPV